MHFYFTRRILLYIEIKIKHLSSNSDDYSDDKDDSTKDEANYSGSNQRIVKYNDETKKALNQVIHEVKNTNKQNGQKLGDFKKKIEDLEDKLKSTEESLNFMQNKYHKQQKDSSQRPYSESNSKIQSFGGRPDSRYKIYRNETVSLALIVNHLITH